jgi:transcriptional regulator with XRE-family HTH domain
MSSMTPLRPGRSVFMSMAFRQRLVALRKERGMTQQALADLAGLNVVQIRRYETDVSEPSLTALKKIAKALRTTADDLLFDEHERGPAEDLRLQFEAAQRLDDDERRALKTVIEGILLKHDAKRWTATA